MMEYLVKMKCGSCGKEEVLSEGSSDSFRMEAYPENWWMLRVHTGYRATDTRTGTHWFCSLGCVAQWSAQHTQPNGNAHASAGQ